MGESDRRIERARRAGASSGRVDHTLPPLARISVQARQAQAGRKGGKGKKGNGNGCGSEQRTGPRGKIAFAATFMRDHLNPPVQESSTRQARVHEFRHGFMRTGTRYATVTLLIY